jgi:CheY-like chemotaxis protein
MTSPTQDNAHLTGLEVLVVDDEPAIAAALSHALGRAGHRVTTATNLDQALLAPRPAILVADLYLGDHTGLELLETLQRRGDHPRTVFVSGMPTVDDCRRAMRLGAVEQNEIRAVLDFALRAEVTVILDKADEAGALAEEIAAAGVGVIYRVPYTPNTNSFDRGKDEDSRWYTFDAPARLRAAGATVAITGSNPRDLLFVAGLAMRGGLSDEDALRAITLTPAEMLGGSAPRIRLGALSNSTLDDLETL